MPVSFWLLILLRVCKSLHVKNKLRSHQVKTLKDIFGHAIQEDQKQKIRALDFGLAPHSETTTTTNCSINAIRDKGYFKCGSEAHFVKELPIESTRQCSTEGPLCMIIGMSIINDGTTDRVMELFD